MQTFPNSICENARFISLSAPMDLASVADSNSPTKSISPVLPIRGNADVT